MNFISILLIFNVGARYYLLFTSVFTFLKTSNSVIRNTTSYFYNKIIIIYWRIVDRTNANFLRDYWFLMLLVVTTPLNQTTEYKLNVTFSSNRFFILFRRKLSSSLQLYNDFKHQLQL
mmetsp:Transcript_4873/g.10752  ORF Transcript_4873/g.10752 Transcript_4873/m.10752 type:complete len:118 (-) Transcript_4873:1679-2032(-)